MKAVILCGGAGTRIRDISEIMPKPMLPVGDRPIVWHIMKMYAHHGVKDFILCLGYKGWVIKEFFINYHAKISDATLRLGDCSSLKFCVPTEEDDWTVTLAETGEDAQTGARIYRVRKYLEKEKYFCMTYGDGVGDIDINAVIEMHKKSGLIATLTGVLPEGRFGELKTDGARVADFNEKPNVRAGYVNGGFMVFDSARIWKYFSPGEDVVLERDVLPMLVRDGELGFYRHDRFWYCIDTPREYNILNALWKENKAPWKVWK